VAAKRDQNSGTKTWIIVAFALSIAAVAAVALLSDARLQSRPQVGIEITPRQDSERDHDRDQIDAASRDQLREILRKSDDSNSENGD
jgi:hypothetical protein